MSQGAAEAYQAETRSAYNAHQQDIKIERLPRRDLTNSLPENDIRLT